MALQFLSAHSCPVLQSRGHAVALPRIVTCTAKLRRWRTLKVSATAVSAPDYNHYVNEAISRSRGWGLPMTTEGALQKTGLLLMLSTAASMITWHQLASLSRAAILEDTGIFIGLASAITLTTAFMTSLKPRWSKFTAPASAVSQGVHLTIIAFTSELVFPGIAISALALTFSTAAAIITAVNMGWIRATDRVRDIIAAVTGGLFSLWIGKGLLGACAISSPTLLSGPVGIAVGVVSAAVAASNLLVEYQMMVDGAAQKLPRWMEWYTAYQFVFTLCWMYVEVLALLAGAGGEGEDSAAE